MNTRRLVLFCTVALLSNGTICQARTAPPSSEGKRIFERWCSSCHADRPRMPGTISLGQVYKDAKPAAIEKWDDLAPEMTKFVVRNGTGPMPRFRKTEISDPELEALATYLAPNMAKKRK